MPWQESNSPSPAEDEGASSNAAAEAFWPFSSCSSSSEGLFWPQDSAAGMTALSLNAVARQQCHQPSDNPPDMDVDGMGSSSEAPGANMDVDGMGSSSGAPAANAAPKCACKRDHIENPKNPDCITVIYYIRSATTDNCEIKFTTNTLEVVWKITRAGFEWVAKDQIILHADIVPEECTVRYMAKKVEVKLKKRVAGVMWNSLEKMEASARQVGADKNWDGIGRFCVTEPTCVRVRGCRRVQCCIRVPTSRGGAALCSFGTCLCLISVDHTPLSFSHIHQQPDPTRGRWKRKPLPSFRTACMPVSAPRPNKQ